VITMLPVCVCVCVCVCVFQSLSPPLCFLNHSTDFHETCHELIISSICWKQLKQQNVKQGLLASSDSDCNLPMSAWVTEIARFSLLKYLSSTYITTALVHKTTEHCRDVGWPSPLGP
jgi:hypothetical protein